MSKEFVLFIDHEELRYINSQKKLNTRHAKWVSFLQEYVFTLKHKSGKQNKFPDALSRRTLLVTTMENVVVGFESIKYMYEDDINFAHIMQQLRN